MADIALQTAVLGDFRRKRLWAFAAPALVLVYLAYVFVAFDVPGLAQRARLDNAATLLGDAIRYKVHVTRDNRTDAVSVAIEGSRRMTLAADETPAWVHRDGTRTVIDLPQGHRVIYDGPVALYDLPGYGQIRITNTGTAIDLSLPGPVVPDFINASGTRVSVNTVAGRLTVTRARTETMRYSPGWELFFFELHSPFHRMSWAEIAESLAWGPRLNPAQTNLSLMISNIWTNEIWRHGDVAWAMGETILMAFLGTFGAAMIALPLAFLAARNFTPARWLRFAVRRVLDFVRGVDALIFTIVLSRAFGPGPMTGALAILITDTGSFGKLFSEALENVDSKPIEGIRATGARPVQRYRFGVMPQVLPVILSQVLYLFESNTRSATIVGAIVGGGIGLLLTQAIQTTQDWEKVTYYIILIVLMVVALDAVSAKLRDRLIKGDGSGR